MTVAAGAIGPIVERALPASPPIPPRIIEILRGTVHTSRVGWRWRRDHRRPSGPVIYSGGQSVMFANGFAADLGGAATAHEVDHQENEGEH